MEEKETTIKQLKLLLSNETQLKDICKHVFAQLDKNKNGVLEMSEFATFFKQSCLDAEVPPDIDAMQALFEERDVDKNGVIDLEEMTGYLKDMFKRQLEALEAN